MASKVWVYAEVHSDGTVEKQALEQLTKARELAEHVAAVALGPGATMGAATLGSFGAQTVFASENQVFADYPGWPAATVLHRLVMEHNPALVLFGQSAEARDVAGRLQAMTSGALISNVDDVISSECVRMQVFGGTRLVDIALNGPYPRIAIPRAKAFSAVPNDGTARVILIDAAVPEAVKRTRRIETSEQPASGPNVEDARVVVAGGRGLQKAGNFDLLERLAAKIPNTAVGGSRAVVDAGWIPFSAQIGQTGKIVTPDVYIAVGISGAIQHLVGMKRAKVIIAINTDRSAPIFEVADLGIVGDAMQIVPEVTKLLSERP